VDSEPFKNDAAEIFLGATTKQDGSFRTDDLHLIVDYRAIAKTYVPYQASQPPPPGVEVAAAVVSDGYVVEAFVPKSVFGAGTFSEETKLAFDLQIDDNAGSVQTGVLWLYFDTATPGCGACNCAPDYEPFCNPNMWGELSFK
jgi:hypothetical protein